MKTKTTQRRVATPALLLALSTIATLAVVGCVPATPVIVMQPSATEGGSDSAGAGRYGAVDVRDANSVVRTYRTTLDGGEHIGHTIPTDGTNTAQFLAAGADGSSNATTQLLTGSRGYLFNGTTYDRARGDTTYGADVDVTRLPTFPVHPYVESLVLEEGNTSGNLTSTAIDLRGYAEVWVELALGAVTATGEIVVTVSNDATDVVGAANLSARWPIYGLLATTGTNTCTQTADGDTEVDVTANGEGLVFRCAFRIPRGPAYAAVRWIAGTGGGATGIGAVRVLRRAY